MTQEASQQSFSSEGSSAIDGYSGAESHDQGGGGGDVVDFRQAFRSQQRELSQTKSALQKYMSDIEQVKSKAEASDEIVSRMRDVFNPQKAEKSPVEEYESELDMYLKAAWDAEKAGRPMPLTANLAAKFYQSQIAATKREEALNAQLAQMQKTLEALTNPTRVVDHTAYANFDSKIGDYVERLYGTDEATFPQRQAQYHAIAAQVRNEVQRMQAEHPQIWEQIRRSPEKQEKMVQWVVEQNQPPKVRQILEQERIKNTPMSTGELHAAFNEAREMLYKASQAGDHRQADHIRNKIMPRIREDIVGRMMESKRGQGTFNRLNR